MANEHDVLAAWLKICRGDTGAGSLVALTGKDDPAVQYGDPREANPPVIVLPDMPVSSPTGGAPYKRRGSWNVEVRTARQGLKLAHQILDRLEAVTTWSAFNDESLDVFVQPGTRSKEPPGDAGGYRIIHTYTLTITV